MTTLFRKAKGIPKNQGLSSRSFPERNVNGRLSYTLVASAHETASCFGANL